MNIRFEREPLSGAVWAFAPNDTALRWSPGTVPMLVLRPTTPGGSFVRIENPRFARVVDNRADFTTYAYDFYAPLGEEEE